MQTVETEHYIFHYGTGTAAERDIEKIAALQEGVEVWSEKRCSENDYIYCYALFVCSSFGVLDLFFLAARPCFINNFFSLKKNEQKKMKKRKNYYFCGFIFALFTIGFLLLGISALLRVAMLTYVAAILLVLIAIATIAFSIYTESNW